MILTVAIPTFNRTKQLRETLLEIAKQSNSLGEPIEVVICDNGSEYLDCEEFRIQNLSVRHIKNETNIGLSGSVEVLVEEARGLFTWLMSDDDLMLPDALHTLVEQLKVMSNDETVAFIDFDTKDRYVLPHVESHSIPLRQFVRETWHSVVFLSAVVLATERAKESMKDLKQRDLVNHTYPQVLLAFHLMSQVGSIWSLAGQKVIDTAPFKTYSCQGAFRVRIRDQVLLYLQLKKIGFTSRTIKVIRRDIISFFLRGSIEHSALFSTRTDSIYLLKASLRVALQKGLDPIFIAAQICVLPGQLGAVFSQKAGRVIYGMVFGLIKKKELVATIYSDAAEHQIRLSKSTYPDYDPG